MARNTAIFSILTMFSRVAGLGREILAASFFGTSGPASAFTLANLVPNLLANLFAQAALSAAFVPVFTDLLQQGRRREAFRLASTLFWIMLIALAAITAFFELAAGVIMPLFTGPTFGAALDTLTVGLSQVLFPVVLLLGLTGLLVGILQSYEHFTIPALAPAVWNVVIIVALVALRHDFHGEDEIYAYAIGDRDRDRRAVRDGARRARADRLPPAVLDRLARSAHPPGVHPDAPRHDRPGDRQPRPVHQRRLRHARQQGSPARDRKRLPRVHAAPGDLQRGGRHGAVPHAQPHGLAPRPRRDAPRGGGRDAPDQPAADPRRRVHDRAHDPDRAAALRTRGTSTPNRPTSSRSRCSGSRSRCPSGDSTCC